MQLTQLISKTGTLDCEELPIVELVGVEVCNELWEIYDIVG